MTIDTEGDDKYIHPTKNTYKYYTSKEFIKKQRIQKNKSKIKLQKFDFPRLLKRHPGFSFAGMTIDKAIQKNFDDNIGISKKHILFVNKYHNRYKIIQVISDRTALFFDLKREWPPIYFLAPVNIELKENLYLNNASDYYTYEGMKNYKNNRGFNREAYIIRGHIDSVFRKNFMAYIYASQWVKDKKKNEF